MFWLIPPIKSRTTKRGVGILFLLLLCFTLILTPGCRDFKPGWVSEDSYSVEGIDDPLGGHFDGEEWVPDNPDIEMTYKIPDIGTGFVVDVKDWTVSPSLQVELLEFNSFIPYLGLIKVDLGVAYQRAFVYVGKLWTSIFEISTGGFVGWNFDDEEPCYGIAFTVIHF